jgi:hypothetical protein
MMGRVAALLLLLGAVGCTDGAAPPVLVQDLGAGVGGAGDLGGTGGAVDLAGVNGGGDGGGTSGPLDAGTTAACVATSCTRGVAGDAVCKLACASPTATCVRSGGTDHCTP